MLKIYNTLTKTIEPIQKDPIRDHLNLYTCGPTVYNYAHIGNLRTYISSDFLYRTLKHEGYNPYWVMNVTDIDDKMIQGTIAKYGSNATVENLREYGNFYFDAFVRDLAEVNVLKDEITFIRVTDVIPEIQQFIIDLMEKGYAYKAEDGIYFSIEKYQNDFGDYGELVGQAFLEGKKVGARVYKDEYEKDNLSDFALWKNHTAHDANIFWDHPTLGKGRPGWHIECSAINKFAFKGEKTDIHTGAVDLIFPHHTNEIAQSQALFGKGKFVTYWSHAEHLLIDGKKMAKRDGSFLVLKDLETTIPLAGLTLRYLFAQSSYRTQLNYTSESFIASYKALEKLYNTLKSHNIIGKNQELQNEFIQSFVGLLNSSNPSGILNDLNTAALIASLWRLLGSKEINVATQDEIIKIYNEILGLKLNNPPNIFEEIIIPETVRELLAQRQEARKAKDFSKSDDLRQQIEALGYEILDTADAQTIRKKL